MADTRAFGDRGQPLREDPSFRQIYSSLQTNEIRILLLSPGGQHDPIRVELEVVASTKSQQYEALSYVWGSASPGHQIDCNNVPFRVTESLFTALSHLRYKATWRRLWADQICIDQNNEDELMSQVTKMGSIYTDSSRVIVWLGPRDSTMTKAWKVIEETCLSVSLVRSDFLDSSPVSVEKKSRKSSLADSPFTDMPGSKSAGSTSPARSRAKKSSLKAKTSASSISRPLRSSQNSSSSSLASSSSSLSSSRSGLSSEPPRTPIRKKSSNASVMSMASRVMSDSSPASSVQSSSPQPLQSSKLKLALSIFQHTYFTRLWTFQEIVLSSGAIFVSDGLEFALADLMGWYFHYVSKPMFMAPNPSGRIKLPTGEGIVYDSIGNFENVMHIRHQIGGVAAGSHMFGVDDHSGSGPSHSIKFSALLMMTRQLQTLKAADRVLSLLGLHDGFATYLRKITESEGWLPVPELFLTAFRYCVDVEQSLDILSAAGLYAGNRRQGFEEWPSWLPDWSKGYPIRPLVLENTKTIRNTEPAGYRAASHMPMSIDFVEDDYGKFTFKVHGRRLGIMLSKPNSWPGRFLVVDGKTMAAMNETTWHLEERSQNVRNISRSDDNPSSISPYAAAVLEDARRTGQVCQPLRTSADAKPGDWVCLLAGGAMLYLLRPVGEDVNDVARATRCQFVGECAVSTFMNGLMARNVFEAHWEVDAMQFELV